MFKSRSRTLSTGLAMFAMFFGAGNIVFPLAIGRAAQDQGLLAVAGMILTAVLVPLVGVLGLLLYNGDYTSFFRRIGKVPGFLLALMILALIGPLAGIPRCITISFSTLNAVGVPGNLPLFSLISCLVIFFFTIRPNQLLTLIGYVLTPVLLISLGVVAVRGLFSMPQAEPSGLSSWQAFSDGVIGGYNTMDLLAAFFFSSVVLLCLRQQSDEKQSLLKPAVYGSLIAATLLGLVYLSFGLLSSGYHTVLTDVPNHELLGTLARQLLGPYAGAVAGLAVSFACLTTEIALTVVFAEYLHKTLSKGRLSYPAALGITLFVTFFISTLHFEGITTFLVPILQICYPALIVLTVINILHKLYDFKPVKWIIYPIFGMSLALYLSSSLVV